MNVGTTELPRWMGSFYSPISRYRYAGLDWQEMIEEHTRKLEAAGFRVVERSEHKCAFIVVSAPYLGVARLWMWWRRNRWCLEHLLWKHHFLRAPYDGALYSEMTWDPPTLWGRPLEKWEQWFV